MKNKIFFISEVSSNHSQNIERAIEFIDQSALVGCSAVKFQLFRVEKLFAKEVFEFKPKTMDRKKWELPLDFLPILSNHCLKKNIQFSCTPFYLEAVDELYNYVDFYKIASYELLWDDLLVKCAETKKPIVLSTGMATITEIENAVNILKKNGCNNLTLLHCTSAYPTPCEEANLSAIQTLKEIFDCEVGWSDHTLNPGVINRAINKWGASMIEFHMDLDGGGAEYMSGHCWLPNQIGQVIKNVTDGFSSDGDGFKKPTASEKSDRLWRADPSDGLRPLKSIRKDLKKD